MTTTENNNKLIAEFMEAVTIGAGKHTLIAFPDTKIEGGGLISNNRSISDLHYHTSWDWLMPVVEKISKSLDIDQLIECDEWLNIRDELMTARIETVYNAVVEFIKWYNNQ